MFEVWLDGANGGDCYYGGAREKRQIDRSSYYDWTPTLELIRRLQPAAAIMSDGGPDVRWVGNERGIAGDPCWATITPHAVSGEEVAGPGTTHKEDFPHGYRDGERWVPAEADVSIRPGWFYHPAEDAKVRSPANLVDLYFKSVGRGTSLLLNLPPDRRGQIHPNDVTSLVEFRRLLDVTFQENLLDFATVTASNERGEDFAATNLVDGERSTYWSTVDGESEAEVIAAFPKPIAFDVIDLREYLPLGQRIDRWAMDHWEGNHWTEFASGESVGSRRLWRGEEIEASKIRLRTSGPVCPAISEFGVYLGPESVRGKHQ